MTDHRPQARRLQTDRDRYRARKRRHRGGRGYDKVTDEQIYRRDKWVCLMPVCLCPDGRAIDPELAGTQDPRQPPPMTWTVAEALAGRDDHAAGRVFLTMAAAWSASQPGQPDQPAGQPGQADPEEMAS